MHIWTDAVTKKSGLFEQECTFNCGYSTCATRISDSVCSCHMNNKYHMTLYMLSKDLMDFKHQKELMGFWPLNVKILTSFFVTLLAIHYNFEKSRVVCFPFNIFSNEHFHLYFPVSKSLLICVIYIYVYINFLPRIS